MNGPLVELRGIDVHFGNFQALSGVDFTARPGEIHALVGENGAGKTTLMRVLFGALTPSAGTISLDGQPQHFANSADAISAHVGMVSQHYAIIPELNCIQNLMLGAEPGLILPFDRAIERAEGLAKRMDFSFDWTKRASRLSPAGAQKLEILKLLWRDSRVMILDEPTAMLSPQDADRLYESLRQLAADGATIIVVTHRLSEVMDSCAQVTVLRKGAVIRSVPVAETSAAELARDIMGTELPRQEPVPFTPGDSWLHVRDLTVLGERRDEAVKTVSFDLREGEVVGVAGVDGNGQRELFQALLGISPVTAGSITWRGEDWTHRDAASRIRAGLRLIPEDRQSEGVIEDWSIEENAALTLQRLAPLAQGARTNPKAREAFAQNVVELFSAKVGSLQNRMRNLSGGNQQRVVAARSLTLDPRLILAFQPTRGLDLRGKAEVYGEIRRRCREGAVALVVGYDLDELLEHCDRVVAMFAGRLFEPESGSERSRERIGQLMVGAL